MNFVDSTNYYNDSIRSNTSGIKSIIVIQRFMKQNKKQVVGMQEITQTKTLIFPQKCHFSITVKVEINKFKWKALSILRKNSLWLELRKALYWSCEISNNVASLCILPQSKANSILIIRIYEISNLRKKQSYLQCSICFIKSSNSEIIHWHHVSQRLKTLTFNMHHYLPQNPKHELSSIVLNLTRRDLIPQDEIDKVFITNISVINIPQDTHSSKIECEFICGWGPQCLEKATDICDGYMNCVRGEDEDNRLCSAFSQDFTRSSTPFSQNRMDHRIMNTFYSYLFAIICVNLILVMFVLFICFFRRSRGYANHLHNKKSKFHKSTLLTQESDMTCSTCEKKSRMNWINDNQRDDLAYSNTSSIFGKRVPFPDKSSYSNNPCTLRPLKPQINHIGFNDLKEVSESEKWLNLFVHVSSEARHKGLLHQPPPNVNNNPGKSFICGHAFSMTPLTCVFPVMT